MPAAAARSSAASAPSSTCRAANRATARRRCRGGSSAPNCGAGHHALLHHRRQFRPQQELGGDLRPADRAARGGGAQDQALIIQVDTLCHRIPNFIEKAARAGCNCVFIGLENINPDNRCSAPRSGRTRSPNTARCCRPGSRPTVITYAGYILGFPTDTPESIARDIEIIKRELPIDILEFFFLTPLPGSEDHKKLLRSGRVDGPRHEQIRPRARLHRASDDVAGRRGSGVYADAWARYYTDEHVGNDHAPGRGERASVAASSSTR